MNNLLTRALTGIIAGSLTIFLVVVSPWGLWAFCLLVSCVGLLEFYRISGVSSSAKWYMVCMALLAWLYLAAGNLWTLPDHLTRIFVFFDMNWHVCAAVIFGMAAIITLYGYRGENAIAEVGIVALGFMYVLLPFMLLFLMSIQPMDYLLATRNPIADLAGGRAERYTYMVPLGIFFLTWALDVFAYFGGKFLGKKKLWERISPKKTWEGAIIGAFFTLGLAVALEFLWPQTWSWLVVGAIISVFSQFGDLVESMYKRGLNLKDSGGILPGHGGVLDRFDGMLITLPMIYLYISAAVF